MKEPSIAEDKIGSPLCLNEGSGFIESEVSQPWKTKIKRKATEGLFHHYV